MRPKKFEYTLVATSATGYLSGATGVGPFTTIAGQPGDGLAHPVTLTSTANLSTITFTITGTSANGVALTESMAGPNNNTVTSTKHFKTVTRISNSATLGANTMNAGWTSVGTTPFVPTDFAKLTGPCVTVGLDGSTVNYTAQQTNIDVFAEPNTDDWQTLGTASQTANTVNNAASGTTAVRVLVNSHTTGTLELVVSQARV